jgi:hypothetical protein
MMASDKKAVREGVAGLIADMLDKDPGILEKIDGMPADYELRLVLPANDPPGSVQFKVRRVESGQWIYFKLRVSESI